MGISVLRLSPLVITYIVPQSGIRVLLRSFAILTSHTIKKEWNFGIDICYMYICRCEKDVAT